MHFSNCELITGNPEVILQCPQSRLIGKFGFTVLMDVQRRWTVDNGFDRKSTPWSAQTTSWQHPAPREL